MGKLKEQAEQEALHRFTAQESQYFSDQADKYKAEADYFREKAETAVPENLSQALIIITALREEQLQSKKLRSKWKEFLVGLALGIIASVIAAKITS